MIEYLLIGLCLGVIVGQMNSNKYRGKYVKRTGMETGEQKPKFREGPCILGGYKPISDTLKPSINIYGTKPSTMANAASLTNPPSGGSNVIPPLPPSCREIKEGCLFRRSQ